MQFFEKNVLYGRKLPFLRLYYKVLFSVLIMMFFSAYFDGLMGFKSLALILINIITDNHSITLPIGEPISSSSHDRTPIERSSEIHELR